MALGPLSSLPAVTPAPSQSRDVTGAQRAFFQAALSQAAPMSAIETATPQPAAPRTPEPAKAAQPSDAPKTGYRPGSLLDIRI